MTGSPSLSKRILGKARRIAPFALLLLAGAGAASWAFSAKPQDKVEANSEGAARPVQVQSVRYVPLNQPRLLVGTVRARVESDIGFRVAGKIVQPLVWPALLVGLVVCMKVYWVALLWRRRPN